MIRVVIFLLAVLFVLVIGALIVLLLVLKPADRRLLFTPTQSISVGDTQRNYQLMNGSKDTEQPLIVALHGFRDRAQWLSLYSGLHLLAEEENVSLALPQGQRRSWNGIFCCGWAYLNGADDVSFIEQMIAEISNEYQIDESRIYVAGFSNGGILAQRLLHEKPELFAGGVSVMSGVGDSKTTLDISDAQAPLLLINGTEDNYVPLENPRKTNDFMFLPAFETSAIWAEHYELGGRQPAEKTGYTEYTWSNDTENQLIQRVYPTSHRWPEWRLWTMPNTPPQPTADMWDFLQSNRLQ